MSVYSDEVYKVDEDPFSTYGLYTPWNDEPPETHQKYRDRNAQAMMGIIIFLIVAGVILVFTVGRYGSSNDYIYWTFQLVAILWIACGVAFMWFLWLHGKKSLAIGLGIIFIMVYILAVYYVLETRYQKFKSFEF